MSLRARGVNSNYNSLQANASKRFSQGLTFTRAYTYSKSLDVGSDQAGFTDQTNIRRHYGPSNYDRTHMFTMSHIYELMSCRSEREKVPDKRGIGVSGWELASEWNFAHRHGTSA